MRILTDTNIIVSAILFPNSVVARVWSYIIEYHHVIISEYSIGELNAVFQRKFPDDIDALHCFLARLACEIVDAGHPDIETPLIRDKTDLPILLAAIVANADILLTGDKDFTDISLNKPLVMSPTAFMKSFMP
ncbi:MAG: putative toxin-antitoxin system toxin component, PIN family [Prevotellaceae bacterium]|jgi:putative PIN family toxin of toxin-antitoxin system|nr:putative toxin-antitoxin system toxin component, PIN family [Prevotellaceae bacterium]